MTGPLGKKGETQLLLALACGATVENASRQCGLTERTIYRRLKDPEFRRQITEIRREMVKRAAGATTAAAMESVKTLLELQRPNHPGPVRLGAARTLLEMGFKFREVSDLEDKVEEVRQMLLSMQGKPADFDSSPMVPIKPANLNGLLRGPPQRNGENSDSLEGEDNGIGETTPDAQ